MSEGTSIINLGELAKPAIVLVEKISDAVGGIFKPVQIKRVANAEAAAALIQAKSEIKITDLHQRAVYRFFNEEGKKQENIESITAKAIPQLEDTSQPEKLDDDWITNFFDKCRIVSDDDMQDLWSRILAGESNTPGTYSKRTVNFIESLDKEDATLFSKLCNCIWKFNNDEVPLVYDVTHSIYKDAGINFLGLMHLDTIGLVKYSPMGIGLTKQPKLIRAFYCNEPLLLELNKDQDNDFEVGSVILTKIGAELAPICGTKSQPEFVEYILNCWMRKGYKIASPYPRENSKR
ncbi:MAG: DUF2806 domain-containing protein [Planctomycetes bacterium]|nr:DUF2806 domain-containing protein [Planctomycetota bacterium]